jgi:hypothetical protein
MRPETHAEVRKLAALVCSYSVEKQIRQLAAEVVRIGRLYLLPGGTRWPRP